MALHKGVLVEMPPHCVKIKKPNGVYVQYTIRSYRNKNGKPTSERVSIGKEDPETGKLIPNQNYYEHVEKKSSIELPAFVRNCGTYGAFSGISKELGLKKMLEDHFGVDRAGDILTVAHYMVLNGNVMYYLPDWLDGNVSFGKAYEVTENGYRMRVHLYYDPYKAMAESERLYEEIDRQEKELTQMEEPPDRKLHYDRYFYINRKKDGGVGYRRNMEAINKVLSRCGFFLIGETDFKKSTAQILEIYRRRDTVEKSFDNLKNEIDMRRLYVQSDEVAEGKMFVAFIALIIRTQIQNRLSEYMHSHKYTFHKILLELDKAKQIHSANHPNHCRLLNPPTKTQREIMEQLELDPYSLGSV